MKSSSKRSASASVTVTVEWGDDIHTCALSTQAWERVIAGDEVVIGEPYWYEVKQFTGVWHFNCGAEGDLVVGYDDGGTGF